jgi:hypothetical protein
MKAAATVGGRFHSITVDFSAAGRFRPAVA